MSRHIEHEALLGTNIQGRSDAQIGENRIFDPCEMSARPFPSQPWETVHLPGPVPLNLTSSSDFKGTDGVTSAGAGARAAAGIDA